MAESRQLLRLQSLSDHYLLLECLDHIRIKPHFGGLLGQSHGIDFVLQLEQRVKKILRTRRTSRHIHIDRHDLVHALQHRIGIEGPAHRRAGAHRDNPLRVGHLVVDSFHHRRHLQRHRAGHDHQVALPRAGTEDFRAEARDIEARRRRGDHFDGAAGQSEGHRPHRGLARPVENVVDRADQKILFKLILQPAHEMSPVVLIIALSRKRWASPATVRYRRHCQRWLPLRHLSIQGRIRPGMLSRFALTLGVLTTLCFTARRDEAVGRPAATGGAPAEVVRNLIVADEQSAKLPPDRWPDLSLQGLRDREAMDRATRDQLHAVARNQLTGEERTTYDLLEWRLNRRLEQFRLRMYLTPFWDDDRYVAYPGILATASALSDASPGKVESFPAHVNQTIALLRDGIRAKMLPSKALVLSFSKECSSNLPGAKPEDPAWSAARNAAKGFCDFLSNEYLPACPVSRSLTRWRNGKDVYRELARRYTTTDLDPKEIHKFGASEVARIRAAMLPVIVRTGYKGSLNEFLKYARTDPRFYFTRGDDLLAAYRAVLERITPLVPTVIGSVPHRSLRVE